MKLELLYTALLSGVLVFLGRSFWDYYQGGRVKSGKFATKKDLEQVVTHCQQFRDTCSLPAVKSQVITLEERSKNEKDIMNEIRRDLNSMRDEIQKQGVCIGQIQISLKTLLNREK